MLRFIFLFLGIISVITHAQPVKKLPNRILVISGGGARGAWGVGVADTLIKINGGYRAVMGISTGSLMAPMILLKKTDQLAQIYTTTSQKDIFNVNPFRVKVKNDTMTTSIKWGKALWRLLLGKKTLGETKNLKKLIDTFLTEEDYNYLKANNLYMGVVVTNMKTARHELKSNEENDYERMKNWIWASSNQPLFMSYVHMDGADYVDGGLSEIAPFAEAVNYALSHHIDTIDVIVNNSYDQPVNKKWEVGNKSWLTGLVRVVEIVTSNVGELSIQTGDLMARLNNCNQSVIDSANAKGKRMIHVTYYFMPEAIAVTYPNELGFDEKSMKRLLLEGRKHIKGSTSYEPDGITPRKTKLENIREFDINDYDIKRIFLKQ